MTIALILNLVLAIMVIVGIVGMLAASIATHDVHAPRIVRSPPLRRRPNVRARLVGRTLGHRA